jgi:hypothetical protein
LYAFAAAGFGDGFGAEEPLRLPMGHLPDRAIGETRKAVHFETALLVLVQNASAFRKA